MRCSRVDRTVCLASLMLVIFAVYYANSTMFLHTHSIDGATITHSHMYDSDHTEGDSSGGHTSHDFTLIDHLSNILSLGVEVFHVDLAASYFDLYVAGVNSVCYSESDIPNVSSPRAPPVYYI